MRLRFSPSLCAAVSSAAAPAPAARTAACSTTSYSSATATTARGRGSTRCFASSPSPKNAAAALAPAAPLLDQHKSLHKNMRHFLTLKDFSTAQILYLLQRSIELKSLLSTTHHRAAASALVDAFRVPARGTNDPVTYDPALLRGKSLGLLFSKRSTRTRVSAESGWAAFGGHPLFLGRADIQLGDGGESWEDTAVVASSMLDALLARVGPHAEVETLAKYASAPVINALSDRFHPLQALADAVTLYEAFALPRLRPLAGKSNGNSPVWLPTFHPSSSSSTPLKLAWVGDANNIINSLLVSLPRLGIHVAAATPPQYPLARDVLDFAFASTTASSASAPLISHSHAPRDAVRDADVIVTDTWVSMGQESEKARRLAEFAGFQVSEAMARDARARDGWKFMHCLPRKPEEVDDDVFYSVERSLVFQEAENRKYTIMAVFEVLFEDPRKPSGFWDL
ncbi:mitochondrial ornithine carbamoyltransferase [Zopfochytrium polystomum]|nr:mitochondrial ornithine carbamoyltransferase [Zopfochytrium polystomum]